MSDLIDRQAAIDALKIAELGCEVEAIEALPSADPVRKKGRWVKENIVLTSTPPQYQWHCSECGKIMRGFSAEVLTDYCHDCGADMRGEEDEWTEDD